MLINYIIYHRELHYIVWEIKLSQMNIKYCDYIKGHINFFLNYHLTKCRKFTTMTYRSITISVLDP